MLPINLRVDLYSAGEGSQQILFEKVPLLLERSDQDHKLCENNKPLCVFEDALADVIIRP